MIRRKTAYFPCPANLPHFKRQLLHWSDRQTHGVYLDSNAWPGAEWECLAASGAAALLELPVGHAFEALKQFQARHRDWLFGFLGYDLKNEVEALQSAHPDGIELPDLGFFQPECVVGIRRGRLEIHSLSTPPKAVLEAIQAISPDAPAPAPEIPLQARIPQADYLYLVERIRQHILGGDLYEMNFCQEFYAENASLVPVAVFERLNAIARAPFAAYLHWGDRFLLCGSPERFIRKTGAELFSQPIKGTRPRGATPEQDEALRAALAASEKDRSENVMIVDLVRNDFARHCLPGSVAVDELFGIYTFATVHQMISTVRGQLPDSTHPIDALRDAFPMGSMTGAPKVMAMELTERYERSRRGLYSGALGYFDPEGNFDFNVVIRSILYNAGRRYVSAHVGGAITHESAPAQEYEECLVKLGAMRKALETD